MSRAFKITLIAMTVILEFLFVTMFCNPYPHGMIADVSYRHTERFVALRDYMEHHSTDTRAAYDRELALMHRHEDWKGYLALGLLLAANVAAVYFFLRYEHRRAAA
jgi:hypothetical protein